MRRLFRPRSWPLTVRISCDLLIAALIPLGIALWLTSSRSRAALEEEARHNLELVAQVTAAQLDQLLVDTQRSLLQATVDDRVVRFCQSNAIVRKEMFDEVTARLRTVTATNPDFASIFVTDALGIGLASTSAANVGQDLTFREYWQRGRKGELYISSALVGKNSRDPGVYFSAPIHAAPDRGESTSTGANADSSGNADAIAEAPRPIIGVAVLKLSGKRVWEILDAVQQRPPGYASLSDSDGVVLAYPDKSRLYRSFGTLPAETIVRIDPDKRFSIPTIESLGIPELQSVLSGVRTSGAASYERPMINSSSPDSSSRAERWIVGFSPTTMKDWVVSVTLPRTQFDEPMVALAQQQALVALVVAALAGAYALVRARSITRPVISLTKAAQRLAAGDLDAQATIERDDEIGKLGAAFNAMAPRLREHLELRNSMAVAMDVQQALLPSRDPIVTGLEVAGRSWYCDETGGDYYDFIDLAPVDDGRLLVALGDVMGHGIASALLMASARAALRAVAADAGGLALALTRVNRVIAADARHGRFMTLVLAVIDPGAKTVRWASAGHDPIIRFDPGTNTFMDLDGSDIPLGVMQDCEFTEYVVADLVPGQVLVLGTDGIWEMRSESGEMFGKERLCELIRAHATDTAKALAGAIESTLTQYRGSAKIEDDVTYVVVKVLPPP